MNTVTKLNLLRCIQPLSPPVGSHPQSFNLLPWRMQYINYRWRKVRRWMVGLTLLFSLWIVGLFTLNHLQEQQSFMQQQWLYHIEQQILNHAKQRQQHNARIGQRFLHQQVGVYAWQQKKAQQSWLLNALQTLQHVASPINGTIQKFILRPNTGTFTLTTILPWTKVEQALPFQQALRIKHITTDTHDNGMQLSIQTITPSQSLHQ